MAVQTSQTYKDIIYSGNAQQKLKLWVDNTEIADIEEYCEEISMNLRVFPNGSNNFNINELISREAEIIVHDMETSTFNGTITFSIGTLVDSANNTYEYIPMGVYNIEDIPTTDGNKTTIKLRDNSIKLDVPYNAKPLLDEHDGVATLKQILDDICLNCGITSKVTTFNGYNKQIGIYDNTINARIYVNYIAGQCGATPIIDRDGELNFIYANNLTVHKIPLDIVEKYELGTTFEISKVIFESGIIKYESGNNTKNTMYVDSANLYINTQQQITNVYNIVNGFKIDSVTTGNIIGDPAIDPYDLIQVYGYYDANDNFVDDENTIVFTTLANCKFRYTGASTSQYETTISEEVRETNVSLKSNATYKKNVKTEIDLINGTLKLMNEEYLDFLKTTSSQGYVEIENVAQGGLIKLKINGSVLKNLYPYNTVYPSERVYPKNIELVIENEDGTQKIYPLNCQFETNNDVYEYSYSYDEELKQFVAKAYYTDSSEVTTELEAPLFEITEGYHKIYLKDTNSFYYNVNYVIQNELTDVLATNTQLSTAITETRNEIDLQAKALVNKEEILADINVAIKDGKGTIELTGNEVVINSDNFKLYGDGTIEANNGVFKGNVNGSIITGSKIEIENDFRATSLQELYENPNFYMHSYSYYSGDVHEEEGFLTGSLIEIRDDMGGMVKMSVGTGVGEIIVYGDIHADDFVRNSLEERKKNFEKFNGALDIIKNTDIYKYHYKNKKDYEKKDIGIVIGDKYNYSKELTNEDNTAMNLANMVGVCFQAIKEQQQVIEQMQKEIKLLKEEIKCEK